MAHPTRGAARRVTVLRNRWPTRGRAWSGAAGRREFREFVATPGGQAQVRAAPALPRPRARARPRARRAQGHPAPARAPQPRHPSIYLQGIDHEEIIATVRTRRAPMMSASARLRFRAPREARVPRCPPAFACRSTTDRKRPQDAPRSSAAIARPGTEPASARAGNAGAPCCFWRHGRLARFAG
jgi:hypothetical protein